MHKPQAKMFYATMLVTRIEEWCVEAKTAEEARALMAAGQGHSCAIGDCVYVDMERFEDAA